MSRAPALPAHSAADNLSGALWMLFSVVTSSAMALAARELSATLDSRMIVFLRTAVVMAACAPFLLIPRVRAQLRFSRPWLHLIRGALIGVSTQFGFYAIAHLPLATATILFFTGPIFAVMLSVPINGERVGARRWSAVIVGFLGALLILRPGFAPPDFAMAAAMLSSLLFALALVLSRGLAQADGAASAYASSVVVSTAVGLPLAIPVWQVPTETFPLLILGVLVVSSAARNIGDLQAYRLGEATLVGPISYLRLAIIAVAAWAIWDEIPDAWTWAGGAVIVVSTLYIALRSARKGGAAPPGGP